MVRARIGGLTVAVALLSLLAGCATNRVSPSRTSGAGAVTSDTKGSAPHPCTGAVIGAVSLLSTGHTLAQVAATGFHVRADLRDGAGHDYLILGTGASASSTSRLVHATALAPLVADRVLSASDDVLSQSSDPRLRSCDYTLSDRPIAASIASSVESAAEQMGLASRTIVEAHLGARLISDNPLNSQQLLVTIQVGVDP